MPVRPRVKAKKVAQAHVRKGHAKLKAAVKKLVIARVLTKSGKTAKAAKIRKMGQKALTRAVGHYTRAAHAKSRVTAKRRHRGGGGGGGLGGIIGTVGNVLGGILGGI